MVDYYRKNSYSVEVLVPEKEENSKKVMLNMMIPKLPHHKNLRLISNTMIHFEEIVDRTNAKTKCLGLYEHSTMMIKELYYANMFQNDIIRFLFINKLIGLIPRFENFWILIIQVLIILINVLSTLSFNTSNVDYLKPEFNIGRIKLTSY